MALLHTAAAALAQQPSHWRHARSAAGAVGPEHGVAIQCSYPKATASPQQVGDQEFVSRALQGEDAEIELSQLAQQKSQSEDVKQFARKMVLDHSQMSDKWFKPLAKQLGVSEPNGISRKDKKLIARLETFSGNDFETEYIKAMVKDHKDDLRDFQSEAQMTLNPEREEWSLNKVRL